MKEPVISFDAPNAIDACRFRSTRRDRVRAFSDSDALDEMDHRRLSEILAFTTNLEHAGDIIEKNLMALAAKRIKRGVSFSEPSRAEIRQMMDRLISNARAATAVFMTEDPRAARRLLSEKEIFREIELRATAEHFGRTRAGRASVATS